MSSSLGSGATEVSGQASRSRLTLVCMLMGHHGSSKPLNKKDLFCPLSPLGTAGGRDVPRHGCAAADLSALVSTPDHTALRPFVQT